LAFVCADVFDKVGLIIAESFRALGEEGQFVFFPAGDLVWILLQEHVLHPIFVVVLMGEGWFRMVWNELAALGEGNHVVLGGERRGVNGVVGGSQSLVS
jgi:hypothetical protein